MTGLLLTLAVAVAALGGLLAIVATPWPTLAHRLAYGSAVVAGLLTLPGALILLLTGQTLTASVLDLPVIGALGIRLDPLSAVFVALTALVGTAVAVFALGYARDHVSDGDAGVLGGTFTLFLLSVGLVPAMDDAAGFLLAWELMAVLSFFLVGWDQRDEATRRALVGYIVVTQLGTACLIGSFAGLWAIAAHPAFAALQHAAAGLSPDIRDLLFVGFLTGFGAKAGLFPLHAWLPEAHPVAPGHVSAALSALMVKVAIYGLIRVLFGILGAHAAWWGIALLLLGSSSAVLGALRAALESDLKRLLAYSTIEHVGIIAMAIGAAALFAALGRTLPAGIALMAALLHAVNHACFKGLLFCGSGAVAREARTRDLDLLGGLMIRMPQTAALMLIGAMALAALPPMNAFASEWLTFQALLQGLESGSPWLRTGLPLAAACLALAGGLSTFAAIKAFGVGFLARPRSEAALAASEPAPSMRLGMGILALACLGLGVAMAPVARALSSALGSIRLSAPAATGWTLATPTGSLSMPGLWMAMIGLMVLVTLGSRRRKARRMAPVWGCGGALDARTQYTATGYAQPVRRIFARFTGRPAPREVPYRPVVDTVMALSRRASRMQPGSIHLYLLYVFGALLVVLASLRGIR